MGERKKPDLKWLVGIAAASSPVIGGAILAVVLIKRRHARRCGQDATKGPESDGGNEVGEEAKLGDIDDPWPPPGKAARLQRRANNGESFEELPEPLPTVLLDERLPLTPRDVWRLLMGNPDFLKSLSEKNRIWDLKVGRWHLSKGGTAVRKVSYMTAFKKQVIGPKQARALEVSESRGVPDNDFSVDIKVHTPEVPYGNSFHSHLQWDCVSVGERESRVRASCEVAFTKPCLVKGIVKRASLEGMRDSYGRLRQHLLEHLEMDCGSQRPGNVQRPAVQQLLLLLLGAILLLAVMAYTGHLHRGKHYWADWSNWAGQGAHLAKSQLADAGAALRAQAAHMQGQLQGMALSAS